MGANDNTTGRMFYPINSGKKSGDITNSYANRNAEFTGNDAFKNVSVNPQFKTIGIEQENSTTGSSFVNSANFIEIRNAPRATGISNDSGDRIVNRILPINANLSSYGVNNDETSPSKIKVYDANGSFSETNRKFIYGTTLYPNSNTVGLDIDNYDYFILINPEMTSAGTNRIRPHFAKITRILAFDEFGDGLEFEPAYHTSVASQSKFEIFKGPSKTDTSVVAVSYGLRGDTDTNTSKYDILQRALRPTFYFYNDRLDEKDQLDYAEKYTATSERYWGYGTEISIEGRDAHTQYANTTTQKFTLTTNADLDKFIHGQSIFDANNNFIGNVKDKSYSGSYSFKIDYARTALSSFSATNSRIATIGTHSVSGIPSSGSIGTNTYSATGGNGSGATFTIVVVLASGVRFVQSVSLAFGGSGYTASDNLSVNVGGATVTIPVASVAADDIKIKIGKTIQNVVFKTKGKYSNTIQSLGKNPISATLVDSNRTSDEADNSFDATRWQTAFPKMKRHSQDLITATANSLDGNLTGPNRYITFEKAEYKNSKVEPSISASLNSPKNKLTKLVRFQLSDNSGLQHLKIKENADLKVRKNIHSGTFTKKEFIGVANSIASPNNKIQLSELNSEIDLKHILSVNDIIELNGYHFVVNSIDDKTSDTEQAIVIKDRKLKTAKVWESSSVVPTFDREKLFLMPFTGVLNLNFESDTEVLLDSSGNFQTLTMNGVAVNKTDSKLHKSFLSPLFYNSHLIEVDYADKNNKYAKIIDSDKTFYQKSNVSASRLYYYNGAFSISEQVFSGNVDDLEFITEQGNTTVKVTGRDNTSKLLGKTITKSLTHHSDIVKTTLPPTITTFTNLTGLTVTAIGSTTISVSGTPSTTPRKYMLLFDGDSNFIGEVNNYVLVMGSVYSITFTHEHYCTKTVNELNSSGLKFYDPYSNTQYNQIAGTKSLQSNILHSGGIGDFTSISERGLSFRKGLDIDYDGSFSYTPLSLSSNQSNSSADTLGYDISSPISISTDDAIFAFNIGNENGVTVDKQDIMTVNSELFDVFKVGEQDSASPVLQIAPTFPMVLGRIDSNTSDSRGNAKLYLVNNNIETGGFIHRLKDKFVGGDGIVQFAPKDTIRYWDLQLIRPNALVRTVDSIYSTGSKPQAIQGYAVGYGIDATGTTKSVTETPDNKPINGSNTLSGWSHLTNFYGNYPLITTYPSNSDGVGGETDIMYSEFEQIDPRTLSYELLATGDIFPSSKQRHNNLFNTNHARGFNNYGIMLETSSDQIHSTSHQKYTGTTSQTLKRDIHFESASITDSSPVNTDQIRRWGVIRLVEATFDWHFNPLDFDSLADSFDALKYFDYVMIRKPVELSGKTLNIFGGNVGGTLTGEMTAGDLAYKKDSIGTNSSEIRVDLRIPGDTHSGFVAYRASNTTGVNGNFTDSLGAIIAETPANNILRFDGITVNGTTIKGVESFRLFTDDQISLNGLETANDVGILIDRVNGHKDIHFHRSWITHPPVDYTDPDANNNGFMHQLLKNSDGDFYDPMNVILPIIAENKSGNSDKNDKLFSPFHRQDHWGNTTTTNLTDANSVDMLHMSRVISGLIKPSYGQGPTLDGGDIELLGLGQGDVYANCIGLFRNLEAIGESSNQFLNWDDTIPLISSPIGAVDTTTYNTRQGYNASSSKFNSYSHSVVLGTNTYGANGDSDQHSETTRLYEWTNPDATSYNTGSPVITSQNYKASMLGIHTSAYPFDKKGTMTASRRGTGYRGLDHTTQTNISGNMVDNWGQMWASQFIVKPTFNLTAASNLVYSNSNKTITFTLNDASTHNWLSFMPNLKGYYLVSEKLEDGDTLRNAKHHGVPKFIAKIVNHTISTAPNPNSSSFEAQQIEFDTAIDLSSNGVYYRLMRISETTFDDTPEKIEFNVMKDTGLDYKLTSINFRTGKGSNEDKTNDKRYQETVYSMYLRLDIDNPVLSSESNPFIEARNTTRAKVGFTEGEIITAFVSDGNTKRKVDLTVSLTRPKKVTSATEPCLVFTYGGKLNGNGVVSFGEVIDITLGRKPKLERLSRCYIGTSFDIGSNVDTELNNVVTEAGLEYDFTKSNAIFTTNIVNTNGTNTIVCLENVVELSAGDVIYTQEGHLIGEILSINNQTITFASGKKYYTPPQYSNIIKLNERTFVSNIKLKSADVYNTINSLTSMKGMDYKIQNNRVIFRNFEDTSSLLRKEVTFSDLTGANPISNNVSLLDKVNRVEVKGDGVEHTVELFTTSDTKTMKINDSSITTIQEAEIRGMKLLQLHNSDARKITLEINSKGFELLEAGDLLHLDFPTYNIPKGDYIIFEIENVLGPTMKMTVGTYSKGIAERLSEISQESSQNISHLMSVNAEGSSGQKTMFEKLNFKVTDLEYTVRGGLTDSNIGFDDIAGFTETVGFDIVATGEIGIKKEYKDRFYD